MRIFGHRAALAAKARQAAHAEKNERAMASMIGLTVDGDTRPVDDAELVAPVNSDEINHVVHVLSLAESREWLNRPVAGPRSFNAAQIRRDLQRRRGAAVAVHARPEFVPMLAAEIDDLERAIEALKSDIEHSKVAYNACNLLDDLHMRQGHSEALRYLGTVAVFQPLGEVSR